MARLWHIVGYNSTEKLFEAKVPLSALSEQGAEALLQRLAARDLKPEEVIAASCSKNSQRYSALLEVQKDAREPGRFILHTTFNPHYTAAVVEE